MNEELTSLKAVVSLRTRLVKKGIKDQFLEELISIENSLKALEVIKKLPNEEKQVLLNAVYTYTKSEEKYDLLKEVLKND